MSTRAVYKFTSEGESYSVYKHHDGYPEGAAQWLQDTLDSGLAWELPRFEADEFAAAFIAANKKQPGGIRLINGHDIPEDVEFIYLVGQAKNGQLVLSAWNYDNYTAKQANPASITASPFFYGRLKDFIKQIIKTAA
jgi:hypothetical protein